MEKTITAFKEKLKAKKALLERDMHNRYALHVKEKMKNFSPNKEHEAKSRAYMGESSYEVIDFVNCTHINNLMTLVYDPDSHKYFVYMGLEEKERHYDRAFILDKYLKLIRKNVKL